MGWFRRASLPSLAAVHPGQLVWYRPQCIGYGYAYGVDRGIPAVVRKQAGTLVWIDFTAKDGTPIPTRRVFIGNLEAREQAADEREGVRSPTSHR